MGGPELPGKESGARPLFCQKAKEPPFPRAAAWCWAKAKLLRAWTGVIEGLIKINVVSQTGKSVTFTGIAPNDCSGKDRC